MSPTELKGRLEKIANLVDVLMSHINYLPEEAATTIKRDVAELCKMGRKSNILRASA